MKKKYTRKKRREIYLNAAEFIMSNWKIELNTCCYAIHQASKFTVFMSMFDDYVPEFMMFKPIGIPTYLIWFGKEEREERVFALLLCAEMTKDK
jgi:hypothetical protein